MDTNVTQFESCRHVDEESLAGYVYLSNSNGDVIGLELPSDTCAKEDQIYCTVHTCQ